VATVVAAANGFFFVTLAVAYLLPLITAVIEKRQLAAYLTALGRRPEEMLVQAWTGRDFGVLPTHLVALVPMLTLLSQRHLAYPILHYFHSLERETAIGPSVAALDEALTLIEYAVAPELRPDSTALRPLRWSVGLFLKTLESEFLTPGDEAPPLPALGPLGDAGIRTLSAGDFRSAAAALAQRRRLLLALVEQSGWTWEDAMEGEE
jgi:hypothetical protein